MARQALCLVAVLSFLTAANVHVAHAARSGDQVLSVKQRSKVVKPNPALTSNPKDPFAKPAWTRKKHPKETQGTLRDMIADMIIAPKAVPVLPPNPCSRLQLYNASGPMGFGRFDWSSVNNNSAFVAGPCIMISGIHMVQSLHKTILIVDRNDRPNGYLTFPGTKKVAFAEEFTFATQAHRPLDVITNTFCSAGAFTPNGTLISIGGTQLNGPTEVDGFSIRALPPCNDGTCGFTLAANLTTKRWYPTAQTLGDGRLLIMGGSYWGRFINGAGYNNPTFEYYPPRSPTVGSVYFQFLDKYTMPYNLYPIVHLLPSGLVFVFASQIYTLLNTTSNKEVKPKVGAYPDLKLKGANGFPIFRSYPCAGTSAMFPLSSKDNYLAEIIICGGNTQMTSRAGYFNLTALGPADDKCWRIQPEAPTPKWTMEKMCVDFPACTKPLPRVMGDAILMADGNMLIINGAQGGYSGIPNAAVNPALTPLIYMTSEKTWYPKPLAPTYIPRLYHSSAVLLHNGSVFVTGSNPNNGLDVKNIKYPSELRTEYFQPPYFFLGKTSPVLNYAPESISVGQTFSICFTSTQNSTSASNFKVTLAHPGFSTHSARQGMRNIDLDMIQFQLIGGKKFSAQIRAPPSLNHAPPTFYWIFLLENGVPNREGMPIFVKPAGVAPVSPFPPSLGLCPAS